MNHYTGIFQLFAVVPVWVVALFVLMIGIGVPFVIADRTTGLFFNVSYSGVLGDLCLIIVVLIGTTVIQDGLPFPTWFFKAAVEPEASEVEQTIEIEIRDEAGTASPFRNLHELFQKLFNFFTFF